MSKKTKDYVLTKSHRKANGIVLQAGERISLNEEQAKNLSNKIVDPTVVNVPSADNSKVKELEDKVLALESLSKVDASFLYEAYQASVSTKLDRSKPVKFKDLDADEKMNWEAVATAIHNRS